MNTNLGKRVDEALDSIRPYLEKDGGSLQVKEITEDMVVKIELLGSCETCPMSAMTLKIGIEQAVMHAVPEIRSVVAINV